MKEISAEMLLEELYPELRKLWRVQNKGTFLRNYSTDVVNMYKDDNTVELSRNGLLRMLPAQLVSPTWELAEEDVNGKKYRTSRETRYELMKQRLHLLEEAFMPIDSFHFRERLRLEKKVEEILDEKLWFVLKTYYDFDLNEEHDELVREAAMLLPFAVKLRGNIKMVATILKSITGYEVKVSQKAFSHYDNSKYWMPHLQYDVMVPGLTAEEYAKETERLTPLFDFVKEHLVPFDTFCDIELKDNKTQQQELLNYNTHVQ